MLAINQDREALKSELETAIRKLFQGLPEWEPALPKELQTRVAALAEFVARARRNVLRDSRTKLVLEFPEPEGSPRLAQQLAQLSKGSALLDHRRTVDLEDLELATRVAFDCISPIRWHLLKRAIRQKMTRRISLMPDALPASSRAYALEELAILSLLNGESLTYQSVKLLTEAGVLKQASRKKQCK